MCWWGVLQLIATKVRRDNQPQPAGPHRSGDPFHLAAAGGHGNRSHLRLDEH